MQYTCTDNPAYLDVMLAISKLTDLELPEVSMNSILRTNVGALDHRYRNFSPERIRQLIPSNLMGAAIAKRQLVTHQHEIKHTRVAILTILFVILKVKVDAQENGKLHCWLQSIFILFNLPVNRSRNINLQSFIAAQQVLPNIGPQF